MTKLKRATTPICAVGIAIIMILVLILFFKPLHDNSQSLGNDIGAGLGDLVGTAVGSFEGIKTYKEGWEEGKTEGLSASDTEVSDIVGLSGFEKYISEAAILQVLVARVSVEDLNKVGDKYAAIYLLRGEVIFTVDLGKAQIDADQDVVKLKIPQPEHSKIMIDETEVENIAEWQSLFFNGSTKDGYDEYMNSIDQIKENVEESISDYDTLFHRACEAARKQVEILVGNMIVEGKTVEVEFLTGGQD